MAQESKALAALSESLSWVPSIHTGLLTLPAAPGDPVVSPNSIGLHSQTHAPRPHTTGTMKNNSNSEYEVMCAL